jgi:hypothetical protein
LHDRDPPERYINRDAYERYLANNPHNESRYVSPVLEGPWLDERSDEFVAEDASVVVVRDRAIPLPHLGESARHGIELERAPRVRVFELCRYLADVAREQVLATPQERRVSVPPDLTQILQLEEWHHPDVRVGERPSDSETFQQLAEVLATGDVKAYRPTRVPNTHWKYWPEGGRL